MRGDREYYGMMVNRARTVLEAALLDLRRPEAEDGHAAPHVSMERLQKMRRVARKLEALANLADVDR